MTEDFRITIIGLPQSGKSSLFVRYQTNEFSQEYLPTQNWSLYGVFSHLDSPEKPPVGVQIIDTSGWLDIERITTCCRRAHIVLIAMDLTKSLAENRQYLNDLQENLLLPDVPKFLVGTKWDQQNANWYDNYGMMQNFINQFPNFNAKVFESPTSAKNSDTYIKEVFERPLGLLRTKQFNAFLAKEFPESFQALNQLSMVSNENNEERRSLIQKATITRKDIYHTPCFDDLNRAIELIKFDIEAYQKYTKAPKELQVFKAKLKNLRDQLTIAYLQRLPPNVCNAIEQGEILSPAQKFELHVAEQTSDFEDIKKIGAEVKCIVEYVSDQLRNPKPHDANTIPSVIEEAATNISKITQDPTILRIVAPLLIIAVSIVVGIAVSALVGGPLGAILGLALGIGIIGFGVPISQNVKLLDFYGMFTPSSQSAKQIITCAKEIQETAQEVLNEHPVLITPSL